MCVFGRIRDDPISRGQFRNMSDLCKIDGTQSAPANEAAIRTQADVETKLPKMPSTKAAMTGSSDERNRKKRVGETKSESVRYGFRSDYTTITGMRSDACPLSECRLYILSKICQSLPPQKQATMFAAAVLIC